MEIRDLEYLAAAASAGNSGRAAKSLGVETSTISRHIGRLEDALGLALFERAKTGVHLTAGGQALMRAVNRANTLCFLAGCALNRTLWPSWEEYGSRVA